MRCFVAGYTSLTMDARVRDDSEKPTAGAGFCVMARGLVTDSPTRAGQARRDCRGTPKDQHLPSPISHSHFFAFAARF